MALTISSPPAFSDTPEDLLVAGQPLRHSPILALLRNSKYGAVRCEAILMGFYEHGDVVDLPVSPVDGYMYAAEEVIYRAMMYSTRVSDPPLTPGQKTKPTMSGTGTAGNLYWWVADIPDVTRTVSITTSYFVDGGAETNPPTNDGIVKVIAICQRQSDNAFIGSPKGIVPSRAGQGVIGLGPGTLIATPPGGYTIQASDFAQFLLFDSGTSVSITLPDDTTPGFSGFYCYIQVNSPGDVTINCVTQTVDGLASENFVGTNAFILTAVSGGGAYETI